MTQKVDQASSENPVYAVSYQDLEKTHKEKAAEIYDKIAVAGGFGALGADFVGGRPDLDFTSLAENIRHENQAIAADAKNRLKEINALLK